MNAARAILIMIGFAAGAGLVGCEAKPSSPAASTGAALTGLFRTERLENWQLTMDFDAETAIETRWVYGDSRIETDYRVIQKPGGLALEYVGFRTLSVGPGAFHDSAVSTQVGEIMRFPIVESSPGRLTLQDPAGQELILFRHAR